MRIYGLTEDVSGASDLARQYTGKAEHKALIRYIIRLTCKRMKYRPDVMQGMIARAVAKPKGKKILFYINHNRYIADCPFCNNPNAVNPGGVFYCLQCFMKWNDGYPAPLIKEGSLGFIARQLAKRPLINRNWKPGESLEFIKAENKEHGIK